MYRLGQWAEDKARPLLVAFGNGEMKDEIMANLRNLRQPIEKFKGISISHDLPPPKREEIKRMVEEAKQEHVSSNGDNSAENYKFIVVGRGPRRKVIRIKRKNACESLSLSIGVINKPTTVEWCITPVYRRLAVAKFSKSTM